MKHETLINAIKKYGATEAEIVKQTIGVDIDSINKNVIIAPWWEPDIFPAYKNKINLINNHVNVKVWEVEIEKEKITYIKTGIGAPLITDIVIALGLTKCKKLIFIGSVGALTPNMSIGDIVIPEYSICGDGVSRYLNNSPLINNDPFGHKNYPDKYLYTELEKITDKICTEHNVKYHIGKTFSIDTILAQFAHLEEIINLGCNVIEMETAATFKAAELASIKCVAIFSVSDNTVINQSLISGRPKTEMKCRKEIKEKVFPLIISKLIEL